MNTPGFIPENLKAARLLLKLSQAALAEEASMPQKDISLHETSTEKRLIPVRYILALVRLGVDMNSLFREGQVRLLPKAERIAQAAEPASTFAKLQKGAATRRKLKGSDALREQLLDKLMTPEKLERLLRLLEKEGG